MQSRIDQMMSAWNHLELLKSVRAQRPQQLSILPSGALPEPTFNQMPAMSIVGIFKPAREAVSDTSASSTDSSSGSGLASTLPRLTSDRAAKIYSSAIELPELPKHLANDDFSGSRTPSPPVSPRTGEAVASPRGSHVKKLRKKASKRLSQIKLDLSELAQKMSPRGGRNSPEKTSPVRKVTPRRDDPRLNALPVAERQRIAVEMAELCAGDEYKRSGPARQSLLFNGKLIGLLDTFPSMVHDERLKALRADLEWRMANAVLDTTIDLNDPQFSAFVNSAAQGNFMKPWSHDSSDVSDPVTGLKKKNADRLCPTFVRDFDNSEYFFRNDEGELVKIADTDQFIQFIGTGEIGGLPRIVSNIASQNLGNFLKNILFLRLDTHGQSQSVLRLYDGAPVMPLAIAKASYVLSKDSNGKITLEYQWCSSNQTNSGKALRIKQMTGDQSQVEINDASLSIDVRIEIEPDGEWVLDNPRVRAKGWNVPSGQ